MTLLFHYFSKPRLYWCGTLLGTFQVFDVFFNARTAGWGDECKGMDGAVSTNAPCDQDKYCVLCDRQLFTEGAKLLVSRTLRSFILKTRAIFESSSIEANRKKVEDAIPLQFTFKESVVHALQCVGKFEAAHFNSLAITDCSLTRRLETLGRLKIMGYWMVLTTTHNIIMNFVFWLQTYNLFHRKSHKVSFKKIWNDPEPRKPLRHRMLAREIPWKPLLNR